MLLLLFVTLKAVSSPREIYTRGICTMILLVALMYILEYLHTYIPGTTTINRLGERPAASTGGEAASFVFLEKVSADAHHY